MYRIDSVVAELSVLVLNQKVNSDRVTLNVAAHSTGYVVNLFITEEGGEYSDC